MASSFPSSEKVKDALKQGIRSNFREKTLFGKDLSYADTLKSAGIDPKDLKTPFKLGDKDKLEDIILSGIASNYGVPESIKEEILSVPQDTFKQYKYSSYFNPTKMGQSLPFIGSAKQIPYIGSGIAGILPQNYNDLIMAAAGLGSGIGLSMPKLAMGLFDKIAGGSGSYTGMQSYGKDVMGMGNQQDINKFALAGINNPKYYASLSSQPTYQVQQAIDQPSVGLLNQMEKPRGDIRTGIETLSQPSVIPQTPTPSIYGSGPQRYVLGSIFGVKDGGYIDKNAGLGYKLK